MSKKPLKRGDKKALEEKMARKQRSTASLSPLPPRSIIFCEGTKTEPHYLQEIVTLINDKYKDYARKNRIELNDNIDVVGTGRSARSLFEYALQNVTTDTAEVWLVYDHDDFPSKQFNETPAMAEAQSKRGSISFNVAWSNECFELWLLLHFIKLEANISRKEYIKKLKTYIPGYHKSASDIFNQLKDKTDLAITNAKEIERVYEKGTTPSKMAPCTLVYKLVEDLLSYL
jgi:hypothetical protein